MEWGGVREQAPASCPSLPPPQDVELFLFRSSPIAPLASLSRRVTPMSRPACMPCIWAGESSCAAGLGGPTSGAGGGRRGRAAQGDGEADRHRQQLVPGVPAGADGAHPDHQPPLTRPRRGHRRASSRCGCPPPLPLPHHASKLRPTHASLGQACRRIRCIKPHPCRQPGRPPRDGDCVCQSTLSRRSSPSSPHPTSLSHASHVTEWDGGRRRSG